MFIWGVCHFQLDVQTGFWFSVWLEVLATLFCRARIKSYNFTYIFISTTDGYHIYLPKIWCNSPRLSWSWRTAPAPLACAASVGEVFGQCVDFMYQGHLQPGRVEPQQSQCAVIPLTQLLLSSLKTYNKHHLKSASYTVMFQRYRSQPAGTRPSICHLFISIWLTFIISNSQKCIFYWLVKTICTWMDDLSNMN